MLLTNAICFSKIVFKTTNHSSDISAKINLHFIQLESGRSFRTTEFEKLIRLSPNSTFQCYFNVQDKRTLELCLARWWSSLAIIDMSYSIEFHSIVISPSTSIHLRSSQSYERFILENRLNNTYEDINGLPIVNWKYFVQTLRPTKDESKIQVLSKRDCLTEQRQIYQLIFVYNFTLVTFISVDFLLYYEMTFFFLIFLVKNVGNSSKMSIFT